MARDGSGNYSPPLNSWNPAINGAQALPADWQAVLNDLAAAIQGSTAADGQTPITGVWNFSNNRIEGIGAPMGAGNALRWEQLTKGADIASAATITIPNEGALFEITGTTGITTINDTYPGRTVLLRFQDAVTLTHSSGLVLPTGANITTAAGDVAMFVNTAVGVWSVASYSNATGIGYDNTSSGLAATDVKGAIDEVVNSFDASLSSNGYQKLPSGLIIQWGGGATDASGSTTITLPVAATTFNIGIASAGAQTPQGYVITTGGQTLTNFTVNACNLSGGGISVGFIWLAITG